jgi:hypothetical protein
MYVQYVYTYISIYRGIVRTYVRVVAHSLTYVMTTPSSQVLIINHQ